MLLQFVIKNYNSLLDQLMMNTTLTEMYAYN